MSVTYTATLPVREETVLFLSGLLHAERQRLGTRAGTRAVGCFKQAILVLRWLLDGTRVTQLAADNEISRSTGYAYLHEGITVLAAQAPGLHSVLLAAKMAGYGHLNIDGTLIETDRCRTPGPTPGVDLWWSGKHDNHGGNVQGITAPDGRPPWTPPGRPGRGHDTTALRGGWICGGPANTTATAGTCRSSLPRTGGRCGPHRCAPAANTTPPPYAN